MLLSDLIGREVIDVDGQRLGHVLDTLLVQDGRVIGGFGAQLRLEGIALGKRSAAIRLGYHRANVRGPAPVRIVMEHFARRARYATWDQIDVIDDDQVRLNCRRSELGEPPVV